MLIDTHAHLFWDSYKNDLGQVIQKSKDAGVTTIINVGTEVKTSELALRLVENSLSEYSDKLSAEQSQSLTFYSSIGIHPHEAVKYSGKSRESKVKIEKDIQQLEELYLKDPEKVIAVGECGLDFLFESNPDWIPSDISIDEAKQLQRQLFQAQIDLAKKLNLPLLVHCRDDRTKNPQNSEAWDEVLELSKEWKGIYHCYSGLPHNTNYIIHNTNFLVSFAANITYPKNEYLREAAKLIPLEKICLETDCPFLAPQSKRGQRNEPSSVREIAELIAKLKGIPFEKVASQTTQNVKNLFKL